MKLINYSSLNETILNLKVFGQYKICFHLGGSKWYQKLGFYNSMRPTKCDHTLEGNWTFLSGVGAKNEGKYLQRQESWPGCIYNLPKLSQRVKEMNVFNSVKHFPNCFEIKNQLI